MNLKSDGIIAKIMDTQERPLVIIRRNTVGEVIYVLMRYKDMSEQEKNIIRTAYNIAVQYTDKNAEFGYDIKSIENFLNFSENRLCG